MDKTARTEHPAVFPLFAWTKRRIASGIVPFRPLQGKRNMLKRIRIGGYESLSDLKVRLSPLTLLFGPSVAGKSSFLDALQLLSKLVTSRTLKEAFEPPYRGKPLESFTVGERRLRGLVDKGRLVFSIEVDLSLSDAVVEVVNRQIREMRRPSGDGRPEEAGHTSTGSVSGIFATASRSTRVARPRIRRAVAGAGRGARPRVPGHDPRERLRRGRTSGSNPDDLARQALCHGRGAGNGA